MAKTKTRATMDRNLERKYASEPDWSECPSDPKERLLAKYDRVQYLNYFYTQKEYRPYVVKYLIALGWTNPNLSRYRQSPMWALSPAAERLIVMADKGWELDDDEKDYIGGALAIFLNSPQFDVAKRVEHSEDAIPRYIPSPIIDAIEDMVDEWMAGNYEAGIDIKGLHAKHGETLKSIREKVRPLILAMLDDFKDRGEQAKEGYNYLSDAERRACAKTLQAALKSVDGILGDHAKKPRAKKVITATKQTAGIKYLAESSEYGIKSIDPRKIVGAQRLFMFNTNLRIIIELVADGPKGFTCKGTTIYGWNADQSRSTKLRKPDEFLPHVMKKAPSTINREWNKLTTKPSKTTGRINEHIVLLRVLDK